MTNEAKVSEFGFEPIPEYFEPNPNEAGWMRGGDMRIQGEQWTTKANYDVLKAQLLASQAECERLKIPRHEGSVAQRKTQLAAWSRAWFDAKHLSIHDFYLPDLMWDLEHEAECRGWQTAHDKRSCGHPIAFNQDENWPMSEDNYDPDTRDGDPPMKYRCLMCVIEAENATLRAQNANLTRPVSDEEWYLVSSGSDGPMCLLVQWPNLRAAIHDVFCCCKDANCDAGGYLDDWDDYCEEQQREGAHWDLEDGWVKVDRLEAQPIFFPTRAQSIPPSPAPDAVREKLREALQDCAENLAFALAKLGVCGEGDGKDHRADAEFPGGLDTLERARAALAESAGKEE